MPDYWRVPSPDKRLDNPWGYGGPIDYYQNLDAFTREMGLEGDDYPGPLPSRAEQLTTQRRTSAALAFHRFHTGHDPMNNSTAVFLLNDDVRMAQCAYELAPDGTPIAGKTYGFKTLDSSIAVGDICIVPTSPTQGRNIGFTTVKVIEFVEPDLTSQIDYKWIVGRADLSAFDRIVEMEKAIIAKIASAEKRSQRDKLREKLLADNPDLNGNALVTALPAPPASPPFAQDEVYEWNDPEAASDPRPTPPLHSEDDLEPVKF